MNKPNFKSFKLVFENYRYRLLAIFIAFIFLLVAMFLPSIPLVKFFWPNDLFKIPIIIFNFFIENSTSLTQIIITVVAILSGINIAMLTFYLKRRIHAEKFLDTGVLGMIAGLLGIGCASCGSVVLFSIFGFSTSLGFLGTLPFKGLEFSILGIILLLISIYILSYKISNPLVCKIETD